MMDSVRYWGVVPAAGVGKRMGADRPKQYLELLGKTVLEHTLQRLAELPLQGIVVALGEEDAYWADVQAPALVQRAPGGQERCDSVLNALQVLLGQAQADDWVLVHDAARPCVRSADVLQLMKQAGQHPVGGLLALPVRDTMKRAAADGSVAETVSREALWHALTPQMFRFETLRSALIAAREAGVQVTDEAQAIERLGLAPLLVAGHMDNLKITHPQDLGLAELFLRQQLQAQLA